MDYKTAVDLIDKIYFMFNRSPIKAEDKLNFFAAEMREFDERAFNHMFEHFKHFESFPGNLVQALHTAYGDWRANTPAAARKRTACDTCKSGGMLHYLEYDPHLRRVYHYVGRCPDCENWRGQCGEATPAVRAEKMLNAKPLGDPFTDADELLCEDIFKANERRSYGGGWGDAA